MARARGLSPTTLRMLRVMLEDPAGRYWGLELARQIGVPTATVYPLLHRLEALGWVVSTVEPVDPARAKPPRRLYQLTGLGTSSGSDRIRAAQLEG